MAKRNSRRNISSTQRAGIRDGNSAKGKIKTARTKKILLRTWDRALPQNPYTKKCHPKVKGGQRDIDRYLKRNPL